MSSGGNDGISLAGRWECGDCGASGDGWWDTEDGFNLVDDDGQSFQPADHVCDYE